MTIQSADFQISLQDAIRGANPALLLASLISITGETRRAAEFASAISNKFANFRIETEMDPVSRARLDVWALDILEQISTGSKAQLADLDNETFRLLAQTLTGIPVDIGSVPFLRDQAGFRSAITAQEPILDLPAGFRLAIIGAGMAGVTAAVAAKSAGIDFEVFEKNDAIGGVWLDNRYPGVGVDTHSKYYSMSFAINPDWTNSYPEGGEFRDYLERVARKNGVYDRFTFGAEVQRLEWLEAQSCWEITYIRNGETQVVHASAVLTAAGYLTRPVLPDVPGIDSFNGYWCHSAQWKDGYDFTGKRLAVVGTGCTAVQVVDRLAPVISSLTLFQRQPHWVTPSADGSQIPAVERWLLMNVPGYAEWARLQTFLMIGDANYPMVRYDPEWAKDHDLSISAANDFGMQIALSHLENSFADRPDLVQKLKPGFAFMGKRPIRDPGSYYETLKRDSSQIVTSGLSRVVPEGLIDGEGNLHEVDAVVYATGFSLDFLSHWEVIGREGKVLSQHWADRPSAYLGCQVPGFPNLFVTSGPNANPSHGGGHNFCVEAVIHYVIASIRTLAENNAKAIEPTAEATERWQREVDDKLADSIWMRETRSTSYYRNKRGEVVLACPLKMEDYWTLLRAPDADDLIIG